MDIVAETDPDAESLSAGICLVEEKILLVIVQLTGQFESSLQ
jgi:hypothetical protein